MGSSRDHAPTDCAVRETAHPDEEILITNPHRINVLDMGLGVTAIAAGASGGVPCVLIYRAPVPGNPGDVLPHSPTVELPRGAVSLRFHSRAAVQRLIVSLTALLKRDFPVAARAPLRAAQTADAVPGMTKESGG